MPLTLVNSKKKTANMYNVGGLNILCALILFQAVPSWRGVSVTKKIFLARGVTLPSMFFTLSYSPFKINEFASINKLFDLSSPL